MIINLHKLYFRELLEIQIEQVGNIEVPAFGGADALEVDVRDAIDYFQFGVASEAVINGDPSIIVSLGRARTFEVFIERAFKQCIGACIAHT